MAILPYYVANLNIDTTYAAITGDYLEYPNLCFVDTLDNVDLHTAAHGTTADLFGSVSEQNLARIKRQNSRKISVIIGNPPYNANQANENHNPKTPGNACPHWLNGLLRRRLTIAAIWRKRGRFPGGLHRGR